MSTDGDCDHCYGTMGVCPKYGPFEYASTYEDWAMSGDGLDWADWATSKPFQLAPNGNRHERRKAAALARRKRA